MTNHQAATAQLAALRPEHLLFWARRAYEEIHHIQPRRYGISSDALADHALGLRGRPGPVLYPSDLADLDACERMYATAPADLQAVMLPILEMYRAYVATRYRHTPECATQPLPPGQGVCDCKWIQVENADA